MPGNGQDIGDAHLLQIFSELNNLKFVIFLSRCPAEKILREQVAAGAQGGLEVFAPMVLAKQEDMPVDLVGDNVAGRDQRVRGLNGKMAEHREDDLALAEHEADLAGKDVTMV